MDEEAMNLTTLLHCCNALAITQRYHVKLIILIFKLSVVLICIPSILGMNVKSQVEKYEPNYSFYHNVTQAVTEVTSLINKYEKYIQALDKYKSRTGLSQLVIRMTNFSNTLKENDVKILLAYGEHAREFFPIESMFYFLSNITAGLEKTVNFNYTWTQWVLNNFDIYIIILANPDGKHYIEKFKNYCWRGTGRGVDINRNFDWNFGDIGSSKDPEDGEFRGPQAFSEPETQVFRELSYSVNFDAFVSFHSGIRHIYTPFADSKSKSIHRSPENLECMVELAAIMAKASPSRPFKSGLAYQLNGYTADGTSFDYMSGQAKIPFSFAIEMWGNMKHVGISCFDEFNPESEKLQEEVALLHPLYVEFLLYLHKWKREKLMKLKKGNLDSKSRRSIEDVDGEKVFLDLAKTQSMEANSSNDSHLYYIFFAFAAVVLVIIGSKYIFSSHRKKRVVSLKSLSSTFSLFKTL